MTHIAEGELIEQPLANQRGTLSGLPFLMPLDVCCEKLFADLRLLQKINQCAHLV